MVNKDAPGTVTVSDVELSEDERQPCEVWTRVMGYYRPVSFFNTGKKGEFHERVEFVEPSRRWARELTKPEINGAF